jgi:hypothetical protein
MNANQRPRRRSHAVALLAGMVAAALVVPAPARATENEPLPETLPSFNESPGCDDLDGIRGPFASKSGLLEMSERIYGPWAHFYGRSIQSVWEQLVPVQLPGQSKTLYVHQRVLPPFQQVLDNLAAEAANGNTYAITSNTWSWSRYTIPPTRKLSFHTVGAAIDVNSPANPYRSDNVLITNMPAWFVEAWTSAGWCWGGDWQSIKDPMHFSWKGPIHTPGYEMPPPQPPLVPPAAFSATVDLGVGLLDDDRFPHLVADLDRDGAVDVVRLQPLGSLIAVVVTLARYGFHQPQIWARTPVAPTDSGATPALADLTGDGRPDLLYLLDDGGSLAIEIFAMGQSGFAPPTMIATPIPFDAEAAYIFEDHDNDGDTDIYVVSPGGPAHLTVWEGSGYGATLVDLDLQVPFAGHRFTTGDRDVDGKVDLFALGDGGTLTIHKGASGMASALTVPTSIPSGSGLIAGSDLDGDGHTDLLIVTPQGQATLRRGGASTHDPGIWYRLRDSDVSWNLGCVTSSMSAGADGVDVGLVDRATGVWCLRGAFGELTSFYFGNPGDYPFMGDWDCDGVDTPGLYRQSDGYVYLRNSNSQGNADIKYFFGNPGDIPLAGDFDGDGCDTVSLYRPATTTFYVINTLGSDDQGLGTADTSYVFGNPGDKPFAGDFDADGTDTFGLHRESTGLMYFRNTHTQGPADHQFIYGNPGDRIVAGDWNNNNTDTPGLYRPNSITFYLRYQNAAGAADATITFGESHWLPISGRFGV